MLKVVLQARARACGGGHGASKVRRNFDAEDLWSTLRYKDGQLNRRKYLDYYNINLKLCTASASTLTG